VAEPGGGGREGPFACVQLEFGFPLGPADGRYVVRDAPEDAPERVIVLATHEVARPAGRLRQRRRAPKVAPAEPALVPTSRATVIDTVPLADAEAAAAWLERVRRDHRALFERASEALKRVNRMLRAHRAAARDPYAREVTDRVALVQRVGYGYGTELADGRLTEAAELPGRVGRRARRPNRSGPQERLAAILAARASLLVGEELLLRARLDLDAHRDREAALQARIALEAMLAELAGESALRPALGAVEEQREVVAEAANAVLDGEPTEAQRRAVAAAVERMELVLARRRAS